LGLKVAVAGKGGAGKTTVCTLLAGILSRAGQRVLLVDLDSDPNLAAALGFPPGAAPPIVHRKDLIAERTGSTGEPGGMFLLNPNVSDIAGRFAVARTERVFLLSVGTIEAAGEGCFCPQAAFVKALARRLILGEDESLVLDLEAGLESFGRALVEGLDLLWIVVEPGMRSLDTARRILVMAASLGVRNIQVVANKVRPENREALEGAMRDAGIPLDLVCPYRDELAQRDLEGAGVFDLAVPEFEQDALRTLRSLGSPAIRR
jgi:CO dehydrogenase maturation factor